MLNFSIPPKPDHMYSALLSKIRNILELLDPLKKTNCLPWDNPKKTYEALREQCEFQVEETKRSRASSSISFTKAVQLPLPLLRNAKEEAASVPLRP